MRRILLAVVLIAVCIALFVLWRGTAPDDQALSDYRQIAVHLGDTTVTADIADTEALRELGLSGRATLDEDRAMLFVFQSDALYSFWMKDMRFPIDMIWLAADKQVVHIERNAAPESYPSSFNPGTPARYVLEVSAGWANRHGVTVGSRAAF